LYVDWIVIKRAMIMIDPTTTTTSHNLNALYSTYECIFCLVSQICPYLSCYSKTKGSSNTNTNTNTNETAYASPTETPSFNEKIDILSIMCYSFLWSCLLYDTSILHPINPSNHKSKNDISNNSISKSAIYKYSMSILQSLSTSIFQSGSSSSSSPPKNDTTKQIPKLKDPKLLSNLRCLCDSCNMLGLEFMSLFSNKEFIISASSSSFLFASSGNKHYANNLLFELSSDFLDLSIKVLAFFFLLFLKIKTFIIYLLLLLL